AGCIVARPRASDGTDACEDDWMIGTGLRVMMVSPVVRIGALWMGRVSTESKITLAARTGFGGSDESVMRTVRAENFVRRLPLVRCPKPVLTAATMLEQQLRKSSGTVCFRVGRTR